jgi:hypothetical protein
MTGDWWLTPDADRRIALTGWIGEHPATGADVAHLLLFPYADGVAAEMRIMAEALGLARGDTGTMPQVAPDTTWATIGGAPEGRSVWLHYGDAAWMHIPISEEWERAATAERMVALTVGVDGVVIGSIADVDRYVRRPARRLYLGLIRLA